MFLQVEAEADIPEDPEEDEIDLFIHEDDRLDTTFDGPGQTDDIRFGYYQQPYCWGEVVWGGVGWNVV